MLSWSTHDGVRQSTAAHTLARLDSVTAMNYRNTAEGFDGLVALATPFLIEAARGRARVRIGIETAPSPLSKLTFASRPDAWQREIAAADRTFRQFSAYRGIAIHHYDTFARLARGRNY